MADQSTRDEKAHGSEGREERPDRRPLPFFPDFALREALTAAVLLAVLLVVASLMRPDLEPVADPAVPGYVPRPEWYFLWLFQSLKYFKGELEIVGTFVLPVAVLALLFALPFLDRRTLRPRALLPRTRPIRFWPRVAGAAAIALLGTLTFQAVTARTPVLQEGPELTPVQAAGKALFDKMGCLSCHELAGSGGTRGPSLTGFGEQPDAEERVLVHFSVGSAPGSIMPGYQLTPEELRSLSAYLLSLEEG